MNGSKRLGLAALALATCITTDCARAQIPVTDIGALAQLVNQLQTLQQQVQTARQQLTQAQSEYQAITGGARGMDQLLAGTVRNYLPSAWSDVRNALDPGAVQHAIGGNAVLSSAQLALLSSGDRQSLELARQSVAVQQVLAQQALAVTSSRFASLQQLINAIPVASDQKGILDLQARIGAEHTLLQNEKAKLDLMRQAAQADVTAAQQRAREQALIGHGSFASRFQPVP
jgi:type IV secretion system protein VirB5